MTPSYLFQSKGLVELTRYLGQGTLFAFDLDGTLAPIVEHYAEAKVVDPVREILQRLIGVAKVSVITGRSRRDALSMLGVEPHLVIGNHGAEWPGQHGDRDWQQVAVCLKWRELLQDRLCEHAGVEIECKGESLSIHYRKALDPEKAVSLIESALQGLEPSPRVIGGKKVVNVLPKDALTKGEALAAAMAKLGADRAIYFGDDLTDEDVFQMEGIDIFGIRIGEDKESAAPYFLNQQSEILGLLHSLTGMMELLSERGDVWEVR